MTLSAFLHAFIPTRTDLINVLIFLVAMVGVLMLGALILGTFGIMLAAVCDSCRGVRLRIRRRRHARLPASSSEAELKGWAGKPPAVGQQIDSQQLPPARRGQLVPFAPLQLRSFVAQRDLTTGRN